MASLASLPSKPLLLLMILLTSYYSPCVFPLTLFDAKIVLINTGNQPLTASCKSNGDDVGKFTIDPFRGNNFVSHVLVKQRTVASCSMTLGNLHGDFDVFDWERDKNRCANKICTWNIGIEGLSLLINDAFILQFQWP